MKAFWTTSLFIMVGLISAFIVGFGFKWMPQTMPYDSEQEGLSDRIIIKFSHVVAENTPKGLAAQKFASLVKEKTDGLVEVQVYPNGLLYSESEGIEALMKGEIQLIAPASSHLTTLSPAWYSIDLPYIFPNQYAVNEAFKGEIGQILFSTLESKNMKGLAFWRNGFKQVTNNSHPITRIEDFRYLKFRILPSEVIKSQFELLGASTSDIPFNQVYNSLHKGQIDGQENTISNIYTKRIYQVQKYMTLSNHGYLGYAVISNKSFFEGLPTDIQSAIVEAMREVTTWLNEQAALFNQQQLDLIRADSSIHIEELDSEQRKAWMEAFNPLHDEYSELIGEELMNKLLDLRQEQIEQVE
jgi:tripartite ATP-independent transporter DctP family solute receptor